MSSERLRPAWFRQVVRPGLMLLCTFPQTIEGQEIGGKTRPAIVVSPESANWRSAIVVPVSRRPPRSYDTALELPYDRNRLLGPPGRSSWAKIACLSHVGFDRLELFVRHGRFVTRCLHDDDLKRLQAAIARYFAPEVTHAA